MQFPKLSCGCSDRYNVSARRLAQVSLNFSRSWLCSVKPHMSWVSWRLARTVGRMTLKSTRRVLGHSFLSLTTELMGERFMSMKWTSRFHTILTHCAMHVSVNDNDYMIAFWESALRIDDWRSIPKIRVMIQVNGQTPKKTCKICGIQVAPTYISEHVRNVHGPKREPVKCPQVCGRVLC